MVSGGKSSYSHFVRMRTWHLHCKLLNKLIVVQGSVARSDCGCREKFIDMIRLGKEPYPVASSWVKVCLYRIGPVSHRREEHYFARHAQRLFVTESVYNGLYGTWIYQKNAWLVHQSFWLKYLTMMCENSFWQKCDAVCLAKFSWKGLLHKCSAEVSQKSVCQKCVSRLSHMSASGLTHMTEIARQKCFTFSGWESPTIVA